MPCCRRYSRSSSSAASCLPDPQAGCSKRSCLQHGLLYVLATLIHPASMTPAATSCAEQPAAEPACSLLLCDAACCHLRLCWLLQVKGEMEPAADARDAQAKRKPLQPPSQVNGTGAGAAAVLGPAGTHETFRLGGRAMQMPTCAL